MSVSENHLAILSEVAGHGRSVDVYAAFDEIKMYTEDACAYITAQAERCRALYARLEGVLDPDLLGDLDTDPELWLTDKGELEKHLAVLAGALDDRGAA